MSATAKAHEPTMEEILASIRRIISDDDPAPAKGAPGASSKPAAPAKQPESAASADPKAQQGASTRDTGAAQDLGQDDIDAMFAAMDTEQPAAAEPSAVAGEDDLDVLELTDEFASAPPPPTQPPAEPEPLRAAPEPPRPLFEGPRTTALPAAADRLLSPGADETVQHAFGTLAHTIMAGNSRTLDDIVREMLRPMLRAWLDDNLPPLVERLVRQEIERVARGGR
jgi:cell pole-organizing protein PopZ